MPRPTFFNLPEDKRARVVEALKAEFAARPYLGRAVPWPPRRNGACE